MGAACCRVVAQIGWVVFIVVTAFMLDIAYACERQETRGSQQLSGNRLVRLALVRKGRSGPAAP